MRKKGKKSKSLARVIWGWLFFILIILAVIFLAVHFLGQKTQVSGSSMYPALDDGDVLLIDRISYTFRDPARFDVVVFPLRYQKGTSYIKRVIGLPGETVQILEGKIMINGQVLLEDQGSEPVTLPGMAASPITLGEDEYFLLGDNRDDSSDSREPTIGAVHRDEIEGKAFLVVWPLEHFGLVR